MRQPEREEAVELIALATNSDEAHQARKTIFAMQLSE